MIDIAEGRRGFENLGKQYPPAKNITVEKIQIAGVRCAWLKPVSPAGDDVVIFIHGGAFVFGSIDSHVPMVSYIAESLNRAVLMIDYGLAPEHPFPGGLKDCVSVITAFSRENPGVPFGIIGDSAGGGLTMATQLQLKELDGPMPRYSIMISPWVDLECKNDSYVRNRSKDALLSREYLMECAQLYAGSTGLSAPLVSPVNADLSGLPSALILCGTEEILEDDSIHLRRQFLQCNVQAELMLFEGEQHVWPFMDIFTAAAKKALGAMRNFVISSV